MVGHNPHSVYITCRTCRKYASWLSRHYRNSDPDVTMMPDAVMRDLMSRWRKLTGRCFYGDLKGQKGPKGQ